MTLIQNVFQADSIELHDLRDNPNTVIKIQGLVAEWLTANPNRKLGIHQTIFEEYGVSALPGIISATYILNDQLANSKDRNQLAQLISELVKGYQTAMHLLLQAGIIDNPFEYSRQTVKAALLLQNAVLSRQDIEQLNSSIRRLEGEDDRDGILTVLSLLFMNNQGYAQGLDLCYRWFASEYKAASPAILMNLLLRHFPTCTSDILKRLLGSFDRKEVEAGREIAKHVDVDSKATVIEVIDACSNHLRSNYRVDRAKSVEFLFEGAVARYIAHNEESFKEIGTYIEENCMLGKLTYTIARYWWQAVSSAIKRHSEAAKEYMHSVLFLDDGNGQVVDIDEVDDEDNDFRVWPCVQLHFLATGKGDPGIRSWADIEMKDLESKAPNLLSEGSNRKSILVSGMSSSAKRKNNKGVVPDKPI